MVQLSEFFFFFFPELEIEFRTSWMLGKCFTTRAVLPSLLSEILKLGLLQGKFENFSWIQSAAASGSQIPLKGKLYSYDFCVIQ
jgi:hypothetical protein